MQVRRLVHLAVVVVLLVACVEAQPTVISLSQFSWTLSNERGYNNVSVPGSVPGDSFTDLMNSGVIGDPYYRFNDQEYRWVSWDNFTYSAKVQIPQALFQYKRVVLWFDGLDTIAQVYVNNQLVGSADNMFRRWIFDIKPYLSSTIDISIQFTSSGCYAKAKADAAGYRIPESRYQTDIPHRNFIRTAQCHFSWDWGPCFLTQGVWQTANLIGFSDVLIEYVAPSIAPTVANSYITWDVDVSIYLLPSDSAEVGNIRVALLDHEATLYDVKSNGTAMFQESVQLRLNINQTQLWWPRGYGDQPRFELLVQYWNNKNITGTPGTYQSSSQLIGFRDMQIIQDPIQGQVGTSFYFQVNGIPVFAKGANWIPVDAFESRVTNQDIDGLVQSAYDANMNTLRNWGGGIYQHDHFYELCDEKGIMVWEEFMFACAMYPRDSEFLSTVSQEVKHQVLRLMYHPSLIIWSGNNENELALGSGSSIGWYPETVINPYRYVVDYNYLNTDTLYATLRQNEKVRPWLPSSPSNGLLRLDPYVERWGNPASEHWGDVHYYNYVDLCTNTSIYPQPRFASEYGFQSYPTLNILAQVTEPEDWSIHSHFLRHRQHHPEGNEQLDQQIRMHFHFPNNTNTDKQFSDWLYLTQCVQALCLRAESEHYRRLKGEPAQTMGALYWQLNSIWQAPTWSSLEYGNHWKLSHYFTKEFFADTIISSYQNYDTLDYYVYVTSDSSQDQTGTYTIFAYRWRDGEQLTSWSGQATVPGYGSVMVYQDNINNMLSGLSGSSNEIFFLLEWNVDDQVVADNQFFLTSFSEIYLPRVVFNVTVMELSGRTATLSLESNGVAPYVFVETPISGRFSRNGLLTLPNSPVTLQFFGNEDFTLGELQSSLVVRSIRGTY